MRDKPVQIAQCVVAVELGSPLQPADMVCTAVGWCSCI
jgi:hypothetical protein